MFDPKNLSKKINLRATFPLSFYKFFNYKETLISEEIFTL